MIPTPFGRKIEIYGGSVLQVCNDIGKNEGKREAEDEQEQREEQELLRIKNLIKQEIATAVLTQEQMDTINSSGSKVTTYSSDEKLSIRVNGQGSGLQKIGRADGTITVTYSPQDTPIKGLDQAVYGYETTYGSVTYDVSTGALSIESIDDIFID